MAEPTHLLPTSRHALRRDLHEVLHHARNYLSADAARVGLAILALPVLTRLLSTSEYGVFQVVQSYVAILAIVLTLNFHGAISRYYFDEPVDFDAFVTTSVVASYGLLAVALTGALFSLRSIATMLGVSEPILLLVFALLAVEVLFAVYAQICIAQKCSGEYALTNVSRAALCLAFAIGITLVLREQRFFGPIAGQLVGGVVVGGFVVVRIARRFTWAPTRAHGMFLLTVALPLVPFTLGNVILGQLDRVMIHKMHGATEAGLYSLAYNIGLLVNMTNNALHAALVPDWFRMMREGSGDRIDMLVVRVFRVTMVVALAVVLFSTELVGLLADKAYHEALGIVPIIVAGYVLDAVFKVYGRSIMYTKKMFFLSLVGVLAASVNVALNLVYIPQFGYAAAAYTTVASFGVAALVGWCVARFVLRQRVTSPRLLLQPGAVFAVGVCVFYLLRMVDVGAAGSLAIRLVLFAGLAFLLVGSSLREWWADHNHAS